jgi:hypothetical protein
MPSSIEDLFPDIQLRRLLKDNAAIKEFRGKPVSQKDAMRYLEQAARGYIRHFIDKNASDWEGIDIEYDLELALGVMVAYILNKRQGKHETRGRPRRK